MFGFLKGNKDSTNRGQKQVRLQSCTRRTATEWRAYRETIYRNTPRGKTAWASALAFVEVPDIFTIGGAERRDSTNLFTIPYLTINLTVACQAQSTGISAGTTRNR